MDRGDGLSRVREVAEGIRSMDIRGAGHIARSGVRALRDLALAYDGDEEGLRASLEEGMDIILASRPTAVSLWNGVHASMRGMREPSGPLKERVVEDCDTFIDRSERAVDVIGEIGSRWVEDGHTIMTHCNSQVALACIISAHRQGKDIEVFATESRPWRQGLLTVRDLSEAGVPVTLMVDSAVRSKMRDVDLVMVGADTITTNGAVINKVGTSQLALCADEARVPFLVCAETYKFSPRTLHGELVEIEERDPAEIAGEGELPPGVGVWNPVFDVTPPQYVDTIVTEMGMVPPCAAYEVIVRMLGQDYIFEEVR